MPVTNSESLIFTIATTALILLLAGFIISVLHLYQQKQFTFQRNLQEIKSMHEKSLLQTQLEIQEQTFQQVSREIHDNISLGLTLSKLHLNTLDYPNPLRSQEKIDLSIKLISEAIENLRNISRSLNSDLISKHGLLQAVENEINNLNKIKFYNIQYEVTGTSEFLDPKVELVCFRIIQEGLNNIVKHSRAKNITVSLNYLDSAIELNIADDGIGFRYEQVQRSETNLSGAGLNNIRQRVLMLAGICKITSIPGKGTCININIPLTKPKL